MGWFSFQIIQTHGVWDGMGWVVGGGLLSFAKKKKHRRASGLGSYEG